jgi:hypothetical protein
MRRNHTTICMYLGRYILFAYLRRLVCAHASWFTSGLYEVLLFSECDSRAHENRYKLKKKISLHKHWPQYENIIGQSLVKPQKALSLLLNIKLAVMNISIKAMDQNENWFLYLKTEISRRKNGIFVLLHIRAVIRNSTYEEFYLRSKVELREHLTQWPHMYAKYERK